MYHNMHGASLNTLTAADTVFLVDHVNAGLGILSNGIVLAGFHALTALNTYIGLCAGTLGNDLNSRVIGMKFLIESLRAGTNTFQACHTFYIFLNSELLHFKNTLLYVLFTFVIIYAFSKNSNPKS